MTQNAVHLELKRMVVERGKYAHSMQGKVPVELKGAKDTVTGVDKENGAAIRDALRKIDPTLSFLDEEAGTLSGTGHVLIITDPLDATTNFTLGRYEYAVMGAALENNEVVYAVITVPAHGEVFTAEKGKGAFLNDKPIRVREPASLAEAVISCNRSNYPNDQAIEFGLGILRILAKNARSWRNFGTAGYEYADVACGRLDGIITPIAESVHVAGYLIMEEAGARVTDEVGNRSTLTSKMIVAAHPNIHDELLKIVQSICQ